MKKILIVLGLVLLFAVPAVAGDRRSERRRSESPDFAPDVVRTQAVIVERHSDRIPERSRQCRRVSHRPRHRSWHSRQRHRHDHRWHRRRRHHRVHHVERPLFTIVIDLGRTNVEFHSNQRKRHRH
jgi:hypothetical protein